MTTETCGYRMKIQHFSALQILSIKTRGYRHKCHPTLLSIELQLQLPTIVTNDLELHRSYFDNYLSKLAFSTSFTIYSKMATTNNKNKENMASIWTYRAAITAKNNRGILKLWPGKGGGGQSLAKLDKFQLFKLWQVASILKLVGLSAFLQVWEF